MKKHSFLIVSMLIIFQSCNKLREYDQKPELASLQQGIRLSTAVGYCASVAVTAYKGMPLPENVSFNPGSGLFYITLDATHPLPFNPNTKNIAMACLWHDNAGVMAVLFGNFDLPGANVKVYGLHLVPFMLRENGDIEAVITKQSVIIGNGSDTILNLGNITDLVFNAEISRLDEERPGNVFVAAKQNVWFINVEQNGTYRNIYDDDLTITGGGQIAEVKGNTGGIIYHALLNAHVNYSLCSLNPVSGNAFTQNIKAGGERLLDLGNAILSFHQSCDGSVHVDLSTGKYIGSINENISLGLN
jgi:hypothetical protein